MGHVWVAIITIYKHIMFKKTIDPFIYRCSFFLLTFELGVFGPMVRSALQLLGYSFIMKLKKSLLPALLNV